MSSNLQARCDGDSYDTRQSAEERRESILDAALIEFAERGLHGTSTEDIAKRAGISQPYVFRLFGSKKRLFAAACARCMRELREQMEARGRGPERRGGARRDGPGLHARFWRRTRAGCSCRCTCTRPRRIPRSETSSARASAISFTTFERISGADPQRLTRFMAIGMLVNVIAAMQLRDSGLAWAERLLEGCMARNVVISFFEC